MDFLYKNNVLFTKVDSVSCQFNFELAPRHTEVKLRLKVLFSAF